MRVAIIGAGIGGLTAALSLHEAGFTDVDVYEAAPELKPLGVGINVLPHAARELIELGLEDGLKATGIQTGALMYANRFGQEIWAEPRGVKAGYRWPQFSIHRGALQMLLWDAARARLGDARLHANMTLKAVETSEKTATAVFADGTRVTADVVIAADGIHSAARAQFYPNEGPPRWNRRILWRGVTLGEPYLDGRTMVMSGHQAQKFVCYPIDKAMEDQGRSTINWIAELEYAEGADWNREDYNRPGKLEDFLPQFESWNFAWLDVPQVIRDAEYIFEFPMVDRDPVDRWTFGRVTLLGDAAHPMHPVGSNGASQAILDARVLTQALALNRDVDAALASYEEQRRPATARIVRANRVNGPEQVMQLAHERAPNGFKADVHEVLSESELQGVATEYKKIAGFDRDALNERPSLSVRRVETPA